MRTSSSQVAHTTAKAVVAIARIGATCRTSGVRTYVRVYVMFDPAQPHIVLGTSETLEDIATVLAARPEPALTVCVNHDGLTGNLDARQQRELDGATPCAAPSHRLSPERSINRVHSSP